MGCVSSKVETEEAVRHFKARKHLMKQAVDQRHAFAAAHASYVMSLKNTGAAIRQMADVEATPEGVPLPAPALPILHPSLSKPLPPPQPPPEDRFPGPRTPLPRAASMPPIPIKSLTGSHSKRLHHPQALSEDNEELYEDQDFSLHKTPHTETLYGLFDNIPGPETSTFDTEDFELKGTEVKDEQTFEQPFQAKTPTPQVRRSVEEKALFGRETKKQPQMPPIQQQKVGKTERNFGTVLNILDDLFLESYEAAKEVSWLLEAKRDYHHTPSLDEKDGIANHNTTVSRILTWTVSSPGSHVPNDETGIRNLASTLDRLHAWEKKLFDEVKAAEASRLELVRRSAQLKNQREGQEAMKKTKALLKSLNTRYLVESEATDAACLEVKKLRDESLYPQLMELLKALQVMWGVMETCHQRQVPLVEELSILATPSTNETSEFCKRITEDLKSEVILWHDRLRDMVKCQYNCATSLLEWLNQNVKQFESEAVDRFQASQQEDVPLHDMCREWAIVVKNISADQVLQSLKHFESVLQGVARKQSDEIKQKRRKEDLYKELEKKQRSFEAFESKYREKASSKGIAEGSQEFSRHPIQEKRAFVDMLQKNVTEEEQRYAKMCEENRTMIFESLKDGLPDLVHSLAAFSHSCAKEYGKLNDHLILEKIPAETSPASSSVN